MHYETTRMPRRSVQLLDQALLELLEIEDYSNITIKDICRKAELSRQTFYQVFDSKEEVMEYHFDGLFEEYIECCNSNEQMSCRELICQFSRFLYQERNFISVLIHHNMTYLLLRKMEESLPKLPMFRLSQESEEHLDYCKAYVSGGLIRILIEWFQNDFEPGIEELSALAEDLISGKIFQDLM